MKKNTENTKKLVKTDNSIDKSIVAYNKKLRKVIKSKEVKFGIKYNDNSDRYCSYCLYSSPTVCSYQQYKHYASFENMPILNKADLFKYYQMMFEVKTDMILSQDNPPTKDGYVRNIPAKSGKWSDKELKILKDYVLNWENPFKRKK